MTPTFQPATTALPTGTTLISASAGTGKTYTIAALVVRLIAELGVPLQRILITTYTIPATAELRDRIRTRLTEALAAFASGTSTDPFLAALLPRLDAGKACERLTDALRDFDEAAIHTIHSFCQRALREHAFETGAAFDAEMLPELDLLHRELTEDYWRLHFYEAPPAIAATLLDQEKPLKNFLRILQKASPHHSLEVRPDASTLPTAQSQLTSHVAQFCVHWEEWREPVRRLFTSANDWAKGDLKKPAETLPVLDALESLLHTETPPSAAYAALGFFTTARLQKNTHAKKSTPEHPFFQLCDDFLAAQGNLRAATLAHFLDWTAAELPRRKAERGVLSFDDLLTRVHSALAGSGGDALVERLGGRFDAALLDEFQDTDRMQAGIFNRLFGAPTQWLFLIGDPKQAIYGFRGADVRAYLAAAAQADHHHTLGTNQRSSTPLVEAVNHLFQRSPSPFLHDEIPFEPVAPAGRADQTPLRFSGQPRAPFRFWFWEEQEPVSGSKADKALPEIVAAEISRLLVSDATLDGHPLTPDDCAVLCANNWQARAIRQALSRQGVPATVLSNANIFESDEAADLVILLAALANPARESLLRAALTTPPLGHTAASLDALSSDTARWDALLTRWHGHHTHWREQGFIQMFRTFIRDEGVRSRLLTRPDGERRVTNLLHLAELLHDAAIKNHLSPTGLLRWLETEVSTAEKSVEHELRLERDDDAVHIVTIHKSKGLEYPVVFCPFLWSDAGLKKKEHALFHGPTGPVLDLREGDNAGSIALAEDERLAEQMRLIYVALTRAQYECHIVWGAFTTSHQRTASALLRLLEPSPDDHTLTGLRAHSATLTPGYLRSTLEKLQGDAGSHFSVEPLPSSDAPRFQQRTTKDTAGPARSFDQTIDRSWRVSSFTALTVGAEHDAADHDRDARPRPVESELRGIHAFPRGKKAGVCLHEIFEKLDFTKPAGIDSLVQDKLTVYGLDAEGSTAVVSGMVRHVLDVNLLGGRPAPAAPGKSAPKSAKPQDPKQSSFDFVAMPDAAAPPSPDPILRLADIPFAATLRELEFHLPTKLLSPAQLAQFAGVGLTFEPRRGVLKGFMDLVLEQDGRFHLVDWKSNWLGPTTEDYTQQAVEAEMVHHHYHLQWKLYRLALHRFLQTRLWDYTPERHLGSVFYLFLRGVDPARPELGVFRATPALSELTALDQLFAGTP